MNHGWVEPPYLSTETADRLKAVVERHRVGKYPQITQITQIFLDTGLANVWRPVIAKKLGFGVLSTLIAFRDIVWSKEFGA